MENLGRYCITAFEIELLFLCMIWWWSIFVFLFYVCVSLQMTHDPFLQARPLFSPVVTAFTINCILAVCITPVVTFPKEDIYERVM